MNEIKMLYSLSLTADMVAMYEFIYGNPVVAVLIMLVSYSLLDQITGPRR